MEPWKRHFASCQCWGGGGLGGLKIGRGSEGEKSCQMLQGIRAHSAGLTTRSVELDLEGKVAVVGASFERALKCFGNRN